MQTYTVTHKKGHFSTTNPSWDRQASAGISQSQVDSVTNQDGEAHWLQALNSKCHSKEETWGGSNPLSFPELATGLVLSQGNSTHCSHFASEYQQTKCKI